MNFVCCMLVAVDHVTTVELTVVAFVVLRKIVVVYMVSRSLVVVVVVVNHMKFAFVKLVRFCHQSIVDYLVAAGNEEESNHARMALTLDHIVVTDTGCNH